MNDLDSEVAMDSNRGEMRFRKSLEDRIVLARFLAACLIVVAIVNVIPAGIVCYQWVAEESSTLLPRWVYLQFFAATLYVVYAIFLIQISDWSALRAVSWALLVIAMAFGLLSTGLIMGDESGIVPKFLELQTALVRRAGLWCVAMLCVATLFSYLGGRESSRWQRSEALLLSMRQSKTT